MEKIQKSIPFHEIDKEVLLIAPVSQDVKYPTPEEYRESVEYNISKYIPWETVFCRILMEKPEENYPCRDKEESEHMNLYEGSDVKKRKHVGKLGIKSQKFPFSEETFDCYFAYWIIRFSRNTITFTSPG